MRKKSIEKNNSTDAVEDRIKKHFDTLSKGERKVATYILDNYQQAVLMSSTELAIANDVGDTTVIRMTKDLGYSGFIEFKKAMRANLNTLNSPYDFLQKMNTNAEAWQFNDYLAGLLQDINQFAQTIDFDQLDKAASLILKARKVYVVGLGTDGVMAKYLHIYFQKMGINTICISEGGSSLWDNLLPVSSEDLILMSSFPRFLKDEIRVAEVAKEKKIPLITFTDSDVTGILWGSTINFTMKESQKPFFNSVVLPGIFCNLLLLQINKRDPELIESNLKYYLGFAKNGDWA